MRRERWWWNGKRRAVARWASRGMGILPMINGLPIVGWDGTCAGRGGQRAPQRDAVGVGHWLKARGHAREHRGAARPTVGWHEDH